MSDSLRTDRPREPEAAPDTERDAKIEQLLLLGLEHYFAEQYDQAIHVWTRALFLDRSHPRARAYIDRARSTLAERQRTFEELLHTGVAAFERGEGDEARRLLHAAIDGGAPADEALSILDRLNRFEASAPGDLPLQTRGERPPPALVRDGGRSRSKALSVWLGAVALLAVGGYAAVARKSLDWRSVIAAPSTPAPAVSAPMARDMELPLPRRGETMLARARALAARGHLRDALVALDAVRATDPQKIEAGQLRTEIQRQLLALAAPPAPASSEREKEEPRVP